MKISQLFNVSGKVAIVTGGSRGIGEMIAAVPAQNISSAFITSSILILLSSTSIPSSLLAKNRTESLVIPGNIDPVRLGVTNLLPNIAKKFAAPTSSIYLSSAASR